MTNRPASSVSECEGCTLGSSRREFLRHVGVALAALATLGAAGAEAAMPITRTRALARIGPVARYPIPSADGAQIDMEQEVILVRWQGAIYAFNLSCPHQRTALKWLAEDARFQCPKHKSKYTPDGTFISGRATRGMDRFTIAKEGNEVVVDLSLMHKQDQDPAGWSAALVKVA
jgi:nitrite reductase/ring-hydroxylating ferredoxin subunit